MEPGGVLGPDTQGYAWGWAGATQENLREDVPQKMWGLHFEEERRDPKRPLVSLEYVLMANRALGLHVNHFIQSS